MFKRETRIHILDTHDFLYEKSTQFVVNWYVHTSPFPSEDVRCQGRLRGSEKFIVGAHYHRWSTKLSRHCCLKKKQKKEKTKRTNEWEREVNVFNFDDPVAVTNRWIFLKMNFFIAFVHFGGTLARKFFDKSFCIIIATSRTNHIFFVISVDLLRSVPPRKFEVTFLLGQSQFVSILYV